MEAWLTVLSHTCLSCNYNDKYTIEKLLGKGAFAKVMLVSKNSNNLHYASKKFSKKKLKSNTLYIVYPPFCWTNFYLEMYIKWVGNL